MLPLVNVFKRIAKTSTDCLAFSFGGRVVQCHIPQKQPSCVEFFQASEWRWPTRYAPDSGWYFHENRTVHMRSILCCVFVKLSRQLGDPRRFDFLKALKTLSQVKQGRYPRIRQQSCGPRLACTSTRSATEHSAPFFRSDKTLKRKRFHSLTTARQYAAAQAHLGGLYLRPHCTYERTCAGTASGPSDCPLSVPCCPLSTCSSALQRPPRIALPIPLAAASYSTTFRKSIQAAWNFSRPRNGDGLHVTRQTVWLVFS